MVFVSGVDEAGRGSFVGPLVIAKFSIERKREGEIEFLRGRDSKKLSPEKREEIYEFLIKIGKVRVEKISASELNEKMGRGISLNQIEKETIGKMIEENEIVYIDKFDRNLTFSGNVFAEYKADEKYPVVAAASIIAKVERDREIERIAKILGIEIGSGYPSDERVEKALKKVPYSMVKDYVRREWKTFDRIFNFQKKISDFWE